VNIHIHAKRKQEVTNILIIRRKVAVKFWVTSLICRWYIFLKFLPSFLLGANSLSF
jgi:hypothetical protein